LPGQSSEDFDAWLDAKAAGETGLGFEEWRNRFNENVKDSTSTNQSSSGRMRMNLQFFAEKLDNIDDDSLISGINNKKKSIEKHKRYIEDPTIKCQDYYERDVRYQKGLINYWKKEIREMEASIQRRVDELKKRGVEYDE